MGSISRRLALLALVALLLIAPGCALKGGPRTVAVGTDLAVYEALAFVQDTELTLFAAGKIGYAQHEAFQDPLIKALKAGNAFNEALLAWPKGTPMPKEVVAAARSVRELSLAILDLFPPGETRTVLQTAVLRVYDAITPFLIAMEG